MKNLPSGLSLRVHGRQPQSLTRLMTVGKERLSIPIRFNAVIDSLKWADHFAGTLRELFVSYFSWQNHARRPNVQTNGISRRQRMFVPVDKMKKNGMHYTAIDLFSGCGGLSQGLADAGYRVLAAVEIDRKAGETYRANHKDVELLVGDIRQVSAAELMRRTGLKKGELDLLAGCPPCQGFSTLRARNGQAAAADPRNDLIDEFARLALALRPKMIMMENVPALAKYEKFIDFVERLSANGYRVISKVLDVSDFGVPQRRKRLILSASRVGQPRLAAEAPVRTTVREAIGGLPPAGKSGDTLHDIPTKHRSARVQAMIEAIPKDGGSRHSLPDTMTLGCHRRTSGFNDVYGRMKWEDVSPTITSGCSNPSKGRFIHPQEDRPITLREAAILQSFPADYRFFVSHGKEAIALMIGNALPPKFIAAHGFAMTQGLSK